jgi:eukaryotic-like serine/threonine-protein kinase
MEEAQPSTRCPRCGAKVQADTMEALCPVCLFAVAIDTRSTVTADPWEPPWSSADAPRKPGDRAWLTPGQIFGPYRIERLLGSGGMGDVYEAEELDQGRRVALKILSQRLSGREDRARFLREGQLAASTSHPHSVYIFGSDEIDGTPVIAMELLRGGTLKDVVRERGALPPADAVDAILQVIAGLDALHAAGVLHRDIKPSNCFVDGDGTVKIGDFGLSISTIKRDASALTEMGTFHGTPQFAAPEQLRGEPLDVRADIYAAGATLYYLLTGQPPFDDTNLVALVTRIATDTPPSLRALAPAVPRNLASVILRCLAKDKALRPATYAELHDALRPFSSAAPVPAGPRWRVMAGALDEVMVGVPLLLLNISFVLRSGLVDAPSWLFNVAIAARVAYFGLSEGLGGASMGKRLMGLRVVIASGGQRPGVTRGLWRSLIFHAPMYAPAAALLLDQAELVELISRSLLVAMGPSLAVWTLTALLFSTARRRNGFAGIHELWSATRVVYRFEERARPTPPQAIESTVRDEASRQRLGPFDVIGSLGDTETGTLLVGFDPRLRRRVWLHQVPTGTPVISSLIRDLNRRGRLRWLGGRRTSTENWDAYEALDGGALITRFDRPLPWEVVRSWLADLSSEIGAGLVDGSLGRLGLDFVWIGADGHARLLDFRVRSAPPGASSTWPADPQSAQEFLGAVATSALTGQRYGASTQFGPRHRHELPLSASALLGALHRRELVGWPEVIRRVTAVLSGPVCVGRRRRLATLALSAAVPIGSVLMSVAILAIVIPAVARAIPLEIQELSQALDTLAMPRRADGTIDQTMLETYIAGRFGAMASRPQFWADPMVAGFLRRHRRTIERILVDHPHVSNEQMEAATTAVGPFLERRARHASLQAINPWAIAVSGAPLLLLATTLAAILSAWLFRGGLLLRLFDLVVVTPDGVPVSRLRAVGRAFAAWGPVIVIFWCTPMVASMVGLLGSGPAAGVAISAALLFVGGAIFAVVDPPRSLQDRIAGTYLIPR